VDQLSVVSFQSAALDSQQRGCFVCAPKKIGRLLSVFALLPAVRKKLTTEN
jgi:hypothetical protein